MLQTPLFSLHLLADRNLHPAAAELRVGDGDQSALAPLAASTGFTALAADFRCLLTAERAQKLSAELLGALQAAGVRIVDDRSIHYSDEAGQPALPASAEWLAGEWYLTSPPRPEKASTQQTGTRELAIKLLQKVAEDADTREIEAIFRREPVLAYHLLRLVNSLGVGVGRTISSFSQAILILGRQQLKRWLNLMLFAANRDDPRSAMLLARVAVRARSMELLARTGGFDGAAQEHAFMTGMFSLLGCLFGMPLSEILQPLKLHVSLTDALLHRQGRLGLLLNIVEQTEYAGGKEQIGLDESLARLGLCMADHIVLAIEAHQWMLGVIHERETANA